MTAAAAIRGTPRPQYDTGCDPRLNAAQSLELAFLLAERLKHEQANGAAAVAQTAVAKTAAE